MLLQVRQLVEEVVAEGAAVRLFARVLPQMHLQRRGVSELLRTDLRWGRRRDTGLGAGGSLCRVEVICGRNVRGIIL